jgi:hypothetical protein
VFVVISFAVIFTLNAAEDKTAKNPKEKLKKKDIRDYNDADVERIFEQWEEGDEPLEEDELPEWKRPQPKIDLSKLNPDDPESMLKMTKHGRTLMMFATVSGNPSEQETEKITQLWQGSLFNAHYDVQRYVVGSNRVLLMLKDGSQAWEIKDFLVNQDRCEVVTIEGKDYPGKGSAQYKEKEEGSKSKTKKTKTKDSTGGNKKSKSKDAAKDDSNSSSQKKKRTGSENRVDL